jgi:hypothetical protein
MLRKSLLERCQGKNAVSVDLLIRRGERAADSLARDFGKHAQHHLDELEGLAKAALADRHSAKAWAAFMTALHDVRTSGATAGSLWTEKYAIALQLELGSRQKSDRHLPILVALHLDAIKVAAAGDAGDAELVDLGDRLAQVSEKLGFSDLETT